jgi:hypothetical protein
VEDEPAVLQCGVVLVEVVADARRRAEVVGLFALPGEIMTAVDLERQREHDGVPAGVRVHTEHQRHLRPGDVKAPPARRVKRVLERRRGQSE